MKTRNFSIKRISLLGIVFALFSILLVSCSKNDNNNGGNDKMYTTQGDAFGGQQNPPVSTTGNARLVGTYNATTNQWDYSVDWSALLGAATMIEFHGPADFGVNGDILFSVNIPAGGSNGSVSATTTLSEQLETHLLAGKLYYTILTSAHVTGEVRGQIYTLSR